MKKSSRGIYILGNDAVLEYSIALVNSVRRASPQAPIMLIPFDDHNSAKITRVLTQEYGVALFPDQNILYCLDGYVRQAFGPRFFRQPGKLRKLACWLGPYEEFVYLDTDMVMFDDPLLLTDHLDRAGLVCMDYQHKTGFENIFSSKAENEPIFQVARQKVFNAGCFASRKDLFTEEEMQALLQQCCRDKQYLDFSQGVSDQPVINYMMVKASVGVFNLVNEGGVNDARSWAGSGQFILARPGILFDPDVGKILKYLHWADMQIKPGCPYWDVWRYYRFAGWKVFEQAFETEDFFISIIVPVYDGERTLRECLDSLMDLNFDKKRFEVIVVDNGSKDATAKIIQQYPVRYVFFDDIQSSYGARNAGIRQAKGHILAFIDADCIVESNWLRDAVAHFKDPLIGCVGGVIKPRPPENDAESYVAQQNPLAHGQNAFSLPFPKTANALYRKAVLDQVGIFNECWISGGDADLCWRMQIHSAYQLKLVDDATVYHWYRSTPEQIFKRSRVYGVGSITLERQYPDLFSRLSFFQAARLMLRIMNVTLKILLLRLFSLDKNNPKMRTRYFDFLSFLGWECGRMSARLKK